MATAYYDSDKPSIGGGLPPTGGYALNRMAVPRSPTRHPRERLQHAVRLVEMELRMMHLLDGHHGLEHDKLYHHDVGTEASATVMQLSLAMVCCGCACQAPYELLAASDRGCGDLISVSEALYGLIASAPGALREPEWTVSLHWHVGLAALGVAFSFLMNTALASPLPTVVLLTLKNGNLVANMVVGVLVLRKRYSWRQAAAVAVVSAGLLLTALAHQRPTGAAAGRAEDDGEGAELGTAAALLAVACLSGALLCRALTGALQELAFRRSGRASCSEMLFFRTLLALPAFALRWPSIAEHALRWQHPAVGGLAWPAMWLLLFANLFFDYLCKLIMTKLIARAGALHATLALTVQKFAAFVISVALLDPSLRASPRLWAGSVLVLAGTTAYSTLAKPSGSATEEGGAAKQKKE